MDLEGKFHEILDHWFFVKLNHGLKLFLILIRMCGDI
jgi:hypothetical protein